MKQLLRSLRARITQIITRFVQIIIMRTVLISAAICVVLAAGIYYLYVEDCSPFSISMKWRRIIQKYEDDRAVCMMRNLPSITCPKNFTLYRFTDGTDKFYVQVLSNQNGERHVVRCEIHPLPFMSWYSYDVINKTQADTIRQVCSEVDYLDADFMANEESMIDKFLFDEEEERVVKVEEAGENLISESTQEIVVDGVVDEGDRSALSSILNGIYPGTKWCGFGNIADDIYDNLGRHASADACCRSHDLCTPIIRSFQERYHHKNPSLFPICHCLCDIALYNCLKKSGTVAAKEIGRLFFNLARMKCFDYQVRDVCMESHLGICTKSVPKCAAVVKSNKRF